MSELKNTKPQNPRVKGPAPESALLDAIPGISAPSTSSEVEPPESTGEGIVSPEVMDHYVTVPLGC